MSQICTLMSNSMCNLRPLLLILGLIYGRRVMQQNFFTEQSWIGYVVSSKATYRHFKQNKQTLKLSTYVVYGRPFACS